MMWEMEPWIETFEHAMSRTEQQLVRQGETVQILKISTSKASTSAFHCPTIFLSSQSILRVDVETGDFRGLRLSAVLIAYP